MDSSSFLPIISGMLGGAASVGLFKGPIQTVEDWWYINFGHSTNEKAEMLRIKQAMNVESYKISILKEATKTVPENLKEPDLKILGPALEASKYYIEEEPLRIMFAKLIASSMDKSKDEIVHSSYVEIIKQLDSLDAQNLLAIHSNDDKAPIAEINCIFDSGGYSTKYTNLFLGNSLETRQTLLSSSLDNLDRLGLVNISYGERFTDEAAYMPFSKTEEFHLVETYIYNTNTEYDSIRKANALNPQITSTNLPTLSGPELKKGLVKVTPFGKNFCATCL